METLDLLLSQLSVFGCEKGETKNGVQIACPDNNDLPDVFIEVGNHYLIIDHEGMFHKFESSNKKILNAIF